MMTAFPAWQNHRFIDSFGGEITPFTFKGRRYLLKNICYHWAGGVQRLDRLHEDYCLIRDVERDTVISHPLLNHYFATLTVYNDTAYIFASDYGWEKPGERIDPATWNYTADWFRRKIDVICSRDLISWTPAQPAVWADPGERVYNNGVTRAADGKFYMVFENNDKRYPVFTCKFAVSEDLIHWTKIPGAIYGTDKYTGGPALYFEAPWFYLTYVNAVPDKERKPYGCYYDTRIARSRDLIHWEDAPADRPVLVPDFTHEVDPENHPGVMEINASDAEFEVLPGKVAVYWIGGDQHGVHDCQYAEIPGTRKELFESFFKEK